MGDIGLIAILVVAFLLAIGLVRVLGRLIDSGGDGAAGLAEEPPEAGDVTDTGRSR